METLLTAFSLGNAAILTNACMLPLYPGLIAFLGGNVHSERHRKATRWLGLLVLAGILTMMLIIGAVLFFLQRSFGDVLQVVLPLVYAVVIVFGVLLLIGRNPFAKFSTGQVRLLRNPYAAAYVYGLLFGPMTLPCTGPIITSAFIVGANDIAALTDGLAFFLAFGLGFGWPLVVLPLVAASTQRRFVGWLNRHHMLLNRASGLLLIAVGIFGILTELLPQYLPDLVITEAGWAAYWLGIAALIAAVSVITYRSVQGTRDQAQSSAPEHA